MARAPTHLHCAQGDFELRRHPGRRREQLQAWCAADLLLLDAAAAAGGATLVVNDEHGALAVASGADGVWTDSALAADSIAANCRANGLATPPVTWSTQKPPRATTVLLRIPKLLPYFQYQLAQLAARLPPAAALYCAGMDKHLSPKTAELIEACFPGIERHRGERKARLFSAVQSSPRALPAPAPGRYYCPQLGAALSTQPNVFSRDSLDIGTRFLLDQFHRLQPCRQLLDLACGNGVLGIHALALKLAQEVTFADESAMAVDSARRNCRALFGATGDCRFHHGDGVLGLEQRFELILCNPPFHLGHTVDDFAGRRLLTQCRQALAHGGELVLVANRHLDYGPTLRRSFHRVETLAANRKFTLWRAAQS